MGLFAVEMVPVEDLYSNWKYVMYTFALLPPIHKREQKMSLFKYECGHNSVECNKAWTSFPGLVPHCNLESKRVMKNTMSDNRIRKNN